MMRVAMELPPARQKGTYALLFELPHTLEIEAGRLGFVRMPAGFAIYVGSAFGPGGLRARLQRHLRREKRRHWHVDALTTIVTPSAWYVNAGEERLECVWAQRLASLPRVVVPTPGFGASDCRAGCPAHLFSFPPAARPDLRILLDHSPAFERIR